MTFGKWPNAEPDMILPAENPPIAPALRSLLDDRPDLADLGAHDLAIRLWLMRYLPYPPKDVEVEAAIAEIGQGQEAVA